MPISTRSKAPAARAPSPAKVVRAAPKKKVAAAAADENAAAAANTAAVAAPSRRQSLLKVPAKVVIDEASESEAEDEAPAAKPVAKRALGSKKPTAEAVEAPAPAAPVATKSRRASLGSSLVVVAESKSVKPTTAKLNAVVEESAVVAPKRVAAAAASRKPAASPAAMRVFLAAPSIMLQQQVCVSEFILA